MNWLAMVVGAALYFTGVATGVVAMLMIAAGRMEEEDG